MSVIDFFYKLHWASSVDKLINPVQTYVYNFILLSGVEFDCTVKDFPCPWHWFLIHSNAIPNCIHKFVLITSEGRVSRDTLR